MSAKVGVRDEQLMGRWLVAAPGPLHILFSPFLIKINVTITKNQKGHEGTSLVFQILCLFDSEKLVRSQTTHSSTGFYEDILTKAIS